MRRFCLLACLLGGCLSNPTVEVDQHELAMARGTSRDVVVSIDGEPDLQYVLWAIDDPELVTVTPSYDGKRLRIGGNLEGETVVHVNSHGQTIDVTARVGPPTIVQIWIEPSEVTSAVGELVHVRASALDTVFRVRDITHESNWGVRDVSVADLDMAGMMLEAKSEGHTMLHVIHDAKAALAPVTIFK